MIDITIELLRAGDKVKQSSSPTGWFRIIKIQNNKAYMEECPGLSEEEMDKMKVAFWDLGSTDFEILKSSHLITIVRYKKEYVLPIGR